MKLKPADIDRLMAETIPKPQHLRSAEDYARQNAEARDSLVEQITAFKNPSHPKANEQLPPPPKSITASVDQSEQRLLEHSSSASQETPETQTQEQTQPIQRFSSPLPPLALKGCNLNDIRSRADLIRLLTQGLPQNEYGLPKLIYRADLLDYSLFAGASPEPKSSDDVSTIEARYRTQQEYLDNATLHLTYAEGFPALPTGEPLWARFPFEDSEHYAAFSDYCCQPGARRADQLHKWPLDQVRIWFHEEYWGIRVRCFDMMSAVHAAKQRENRIMSCEDDHFLQASNMLNRLKALLPTVDWDVLTDDPKQFVEVMERVIKLQRVSLGLSSMGNINDRREIQAPSIQETMRKVAEPQNLLPREGSDDVFDVKQVLRNPEALASAQELIIRMTKSIRDSQQ